MRSRKKMRKRMSNRCNNSRNKRKRATSNKYLKYRRRSNYSPIIKINRQIKKLVRIWLVKESNLIKWYCKQNLISYRQKKKKTWI